MKRRQPDNVKGYVCVANRKLLSTSHGDSFGIHGWLSPPKPCTSLVQSYPQLAWWNGSLQRATNAVRDQADRPNKLRLNTFTHLPTIVHGTKLFDVLWWSFIIIYPTTLSTFLFKCSKMFKAFKPYSKHAMSHAACAEAVAHSFTWVPGTAVRTVSRSFLESHFAAIRMNPANLKEFWRAGYC